MQFREDNSGVGGLIIMQPEAGYCYNNDSIILADFAKGENKGETLDMCSGCGIIGLVLAGVYSHGRVTCLELQEELAQANAMNITLNNLSDRVSLLCGKVQDAVNSLGKARFDKIVCNPPYDLPLNEISNQQIAIARQEREITLKELCVAASELIKPNGEFFLIHRADRLAEVLENLKANKLEPKVLRFVHPKPDINARLMLIKAVKGAKPEASVLSPLILNNSDGSISSEVNAIYKRGNVL